MANNPMCRHCHKCKVNRPRGLCWGCYYTPGIKEQYPSTSKYARRGVGNSTSRSPLPPLPTTAPPGSPQKLRVLEERARLHQALFHPFDARYEGDPLTLEYLEQLQRSVANSPSRAA
jgi:hypothetical protein